MLNITYNQIEHRNIMILEGRVDGLTATKLEMELNKRIGDGERSLVIDCDALTYVSSAGLRVFLSAHKLLKAAGGEVILMKLPSSVMDVFRVSYFDKIFRILKDEEQLPELHSKQQTEDTDKSFSMEGTEFRITARKESAHAEYSLIGDNSPLRTASYNLSDIKTILSGNIKYGLGLASAGGDDDEAAGLMGEAAIINNSLFYYPAIENPQVDYVFHEKDSKEQSYKFLNGISFNGEFAKLISFSPGRKGMALSLLPEVLFMNSNSDLLGIVMLAESKGVIGMNIKRTPFRANKPNNGSVIDSHDNFRDWFNYQAEAGFYNNIILGIGIVAKHDAPIPNSLMHNLPGKNHFHMHAVIFENTPLNQNTASFEMELHRIITSSKALSVQHVMGKSRLDRGNIGTIDLKY